MPFSLETLASVATILGTAISVLALLQSRAWLVVTSLFFVALAMAGGLYARRERQARDSASTVIEGYSIDSLNMANLRRRLDRRFVIQSADHMAQLEGEDLKITWKYSGYCRTGRASAFDFSIDSAAKTPFKDLDCVAYDLGHDPNMAHAIRPLLVGPEGISKKITVPLLEPIQANQAFAVLLKCTLPRCITAGTGYYTSTLSFDQPQIQKCTVRLQFIGAPPSWMRVYECSKPGQPVLLKSLTPSRQDRDFYEYIDVVQDAPGQSMRVYMFWRDSV
jgi:hypothetical protein